MGKTNYQKGVWEDRKLGDTLKESVIQVIYGEALRSAKPVFCIVDDTISFRTGHQSVSVMLSCNGIVLNYAVILYNKSVWMLRKRNRTLQKSFRSRLLVPVFCVTVGIPPQHSWMPLSKKALIPLEPFGQTASYIPKVSGKRSGRLPSFYRKHRLLSTS